MRFGLVGADVSDLLWVGDLVGVKGYVGLWGEVHCVGALNTDPNSLCEATKFV